MGDRSPHPTWFFVMVIVRDGDRFAIVREQKHGGGWYLPAGRVEKGETLFEAALRETREEAGIDVELTGLARVEHAPQPGGGARVRVFFTARPRGSTALKRVADEHSVEARWVRPEELDGLALRGEEVRACFEHIARGGHVAPISLVTDEGARWGGGER